MKTNQKHFIRMNENLFFSRNCAYLELKRVGVELVASSFGLGGRVKL